MVNRSTTSAPRGPTASFGTAAGEPEQACERSVDAFPVEATPGEAFNDSRARTRAAGVPSPPLPCAAVTDPPCRVYERGYLDSFVSYEDQAYKEREWWTERAQSYSATPNQISGAAGEGLAKRDPQFYIEELQEVPDALSVPPTGPPPSLSPDSTRVFVVAGPTETSPWEKHAALTRPHTEIETWDGRTETIVLATPLGYEPRWLWQTGPLAQSAGSLFVRSFERGERVHQAMVARGFNGRIPAYGDEKVTVRQWLIGLIVPGAAVVLALLAMTVL